MKMKQIVRLSVLILALFAIVANLGLLQILTCNMTAPKLKLDESFSWRNGSYERIFYGESDAQFIDLYIPSDTVSPRLFVLAHGGGFVANDAQSRQAQFMYRFFRDRGFACASVNYRLADEAPFPGACDDVHNAVVFLSQNAQEYGYDASNIAIWGESAGGYLATREALTETDAPITTLVSYYGCYELAVMGAQFEQQGISRFIRTVSSFWTAGKLNGYSSCEEFWMRNAYKDWPDEDRNAARVLAIAERGPANRSLDVMLVHGTADITVPMQQSVNLAEALRAFYGSEHVNFITVENCIHADDRLYSDEILTTVESFLHSR